MPVPYAFGAATTAIPLSQLDDNFNTTITLGNTAIQLGNTVTTLNNMTLANVTISSGNVTITNVSVTTVNAATVNTTTLVATTANVTTINATDVNVAANVTLNAGTANGVAYLNGSKVLTTGSALTFDGNNLSIGANGQVGSRLSVIANGAMATFNTGAAADGRIEYAYNGTNIFYTGVNSALLMMLMARSGVELGFGVNNAEQMRLTSTGLGIGVNSPGAKLDVNGQVRAAFASGFQVDNAGTMLGKLYYSGGLVLDRAASTNLVFQQNSATQMLLDSSGNLGLGVTPSANWATGTRALQIGSGTALWNPGSGAQSWLLANAYYDQTDNRFEYLNAGSAGAYAIVGNSHQWHISSGATGAGNPTSFTQAMTLDASGRLGIGTTSPLATLEVNDYTNTSYTELVAFTGAKGSFIGIPTNQLAIVDSTAQAAGVGGEISFEGKYDASNITCFASIGGVKENSTSSDYGGALVIKTRANGGNNTERARIDSSGNLLVQATSSSVTSDVGHKIRPDAAAPFMGTVGSSTSGVDVTYSLYSTGAAAYRFYVGYNGTISATTTTISGISDVRLKENIRDLDDGLTAVMALKPRKFDWKAGKGKDIKDDRGFIAQEFEQVFPDMIDEWKDPAPEGEEPYKAVNANLIPTLVKAIQELKAEVDSLKAQLKGA